MATDYKQKVMMSDSVGFVECLEKFGDDLTVVNAARVSFDKESYELTEGDKKLINYLAKHDHTSPFFHPQVRFRIKMPILYVENILGTQLAYPEMKLVAAT